MIKRDFDRESIPNVCTRRTSCHPAVSALHPSHGTACTRAIFFCVLSLIFFGGGFLSLGRRAVS